MNKYNESTSNDMGTLTEDARALMAAIAVVAGEKIGNARKHLVTALERGKEISGHVRDKAVERTKIVDQNVRENPYQAIAIGFGVGVIVGYFVARCSRNSD